MVNKENIVPLILVGGAARVGKTTVVRKLLKTYPYYSLSIDDLKYMINPELIRQKKEKIARLEIQVEALNRRGTKLLDEIDQIKKYGL